jgi:fermentation-respiration switch protein FrsA (DUF1100 family)
MALRMKIGWRRLAIELVVVALVAYLGALVGLTLNQRVFIYHPNTARASLADGFQAQDIRTPDGEHIVAWWKPPSRPGEGVVLYLHGKGGNLGDRASRLRDLGQQRFGVLAIDWRGYGGSSGKPTERGLNADALAAYDWIHAQAPGAKIAAFGESLGTGPAITLATKRPVAGVVLDSAYASILRLADLRLPVVPNAWLMIDTYRSEDRIARVNAPLLMAHCDADSVIPIAEARRLFAAARQPKEMVVLHGCGHVDTWREPFKSQLTARLHTWLDLK